MLFTSLDFLYFFGAFFFLYWLVFKNKTASQNFLLLFANYVFYAWAEWRLLIYLIFASAVNFLLAILIEKAKEYKTKKNLALLGILQGVGGLVYFKYSNFFISSLTKVLQSIGFRVHIDTLSILAPLGISYFTFKTISYIVDVKNEKIPACKNWVDFFAFVSFFPTILSGPIDKARDFLPQLSSPRKFDCDNAIAASKQFLLGMFKKIVIADAIYPIVEDIFSNHAVYNTHVLIAGAFLYSIQIYADFSGYSDMAIAIARLLGFRVTKNFNFPFFSKNIADFWRRWHISLTSWLTEYVYTPLSIYFRNWGKIGLIVAIVTNFLLCGLWHGADWTYVIWGGLNGLYFVPLILSGNFNRKRKAKTEKKFASARTILSMIGVFILFSFSQIIFRSPTLSQASSFFKDILKLNFNNEYGFYPITRKGVCLIILFFLVECWLSFEVKPFYLPKSLEYLLILFAGVLIIMSWGQVSAFIYFKF